MVFANFRGMMDTFLLVGWVGLLLLSAAGFYRNRTSLSNVVMLFLSLGVLVLWVTHRSSNDAFLILVSALLIIPLLMALPILTIALLANGLVMFRRESRTLGNLLSLLVGLVIVAMSWSMLRIFGNGTDVNPSLGWLWLGAAMVLGYFALAFVVYLLASILYSTVPTRLVPKYGIVLGARLIDGTVPPLLQSRLDRAIELYKEMESKGRTLILIPSGGQGKDETKPEGVGMAEYLYAQGIPQEHVIIEDEAINTRENLTLSRNLMDNRNDPTAIITNNYHVFRSALLARRIGMNAFVYGAKTKFYYLPSAVIREFLAIMVQNKWLNALVVAVLLGFGVSGYIQTAWS